MMHLLRICTCLALLAGLATAAPSPPTTNSGTEVEGHVVNSDGTPIRGANVAIVNDSGRVLGGVATDASGAFALRLPPLEETVSLRVSSVGYLPYTRRIDRQHAMRRPLRLELQATAIDLGTVAVTPRPEIEPANLTLNAHRLSARARQSLVPTNPVGAIRNVEIARAGSSHSSQLRVHGTSPVYYFNGTSIGTDPDHYGMFTILPSTVVDRIELETHGTTAEHQVSSVVSMTAPQRFRDHQELDFNLSTIEATGTFGLGNEKAFALGALRKSVLDKLVTYFQISDDRRTLPPTNFQDVAIVSGWQVGTNTRLLFDQYHANDHLSYRVDSERDQGFVDTYQHASEHFYSLRGRHLFDRALVELALSMRRSFETYDAEPIAAADADRLRLDLSQERRAFALASKVKGSVRGTHLTAGTQTTWVTNRTIHLEQTNWNFLPPFAPTDNPYIYQPALNFDYGSYHDRAAETNHAAYLSGKRSLGPVALEVGLRGEFHTVLDQKWALLFRGSVTVPIDRTSSVRVFAGTFTEHPVSNVLEPYQVLIHDQLYRLAPIRSRLLSATYTRGPISATVYDKRITDLPVIAPNFALTGQAVDPDDPYLELLHVGSTGRAHFRGLSLALEQRAFLDPRLNVSLSYGYTHARQTEYGVTMPHDLHAPHRLMTQVEYQWKPGFMVGGELTVRSGYPYTQSKDYQTSYEEGELTPEWYRNQLAFENRERFPANVSLNLFFSADIGRGGELYGSIANATNRDNPIINTSSGYILDSGILPTLGVRFKF